MSHLARTVLISLLALSAVAAWGSPPRAAAQKGSLPKTQDNVALGENDVVRILPLMDTDKNGKISKEEFMKYMEAEFQRLDKNKDGQLDVKELTKAKTNSTPSSARTK